ncbi:Pickpocket protein 28 [Eumeta japonica]|uniref:Pickpocket protein 28 n=1 Tax=Eumeta variegata TaxID=151549 RepID=A0A4C1VEU8_EUMVA|nr:Pickpocket protein 28 [Eumeta japonica]
MDDCRNQYEKSLLQIQVLQEEVHICKMNIDKLQHELALYRIYLHHPVDTPRSTMYSYAVLRDQTTSLAVSFKMITTSEKLKDNNSEQLCCNHQRDCVNKAKEELAAREMKIALEAAAGNSSEEGCRCLPACDSVKYEAEVLKSDFDLITHLKTVNNMINVTDDERYHYSRVLVYFRDAQFASMTRSELFGVTDFLANCGGLLGLFLGFSFLSLVEIIYFMSLRQCCVAKRERTKNNENENGKRE